MSFNRGPKRNAFGNNRSNFNRGSGGGGNMPVGNAMGGSGGGTGSRGVNPWESGVMPGRGILPTPNNNLSLSSPQAQLVIASNLLSNLLRTQQDGGSAPLPSLMSLNNSSNGPSSNFRGQQNYGGPGRLNDRPARSNLKNPRPQPYNKMGNRARDGIAGRRGPSTAQQSRAQSQSGNQRQNGNQNQHRNDKNSKANTGSKQNQTKKQEQQDVKTSDNEKPDTETVVKSEEKEPETAEVSEDKKDTAETTETTPADENTGEEVKKEAGDKPVSQEKKAEEGQTGKKSEARHAESRYSAVPISHMVCHVCNKRMWDGFSFENHLRGRAHQLMMEKLDESYKLKVDLMRHELRVAEEQREMSLNNSKRRGKKVSVDLNVREYCTMCDLNFYGTLSSHRKSDKHQQLKTFLHPRCFPCVKEFPSRIEYDEHCLTPQHMLNAIQNEELKKSKKSKLAKGESEVRTGEDEEKDVGSDPKATDKEEELPENIEYLTDIVEEMDMTKYKVPSYKYCRSKQISLGASLVKEVQGFHCEKCRRFMATADDMAAHLKTLTHYRSFVNEVKALTAPPPAAEPPKTEETPKTEENTVDESGIPVKRLKLNEEVKSEEKPAEEGQEGEEKPKEDGNEKYDPLEADAESEEEAKEANKEETTENTENTESTENSEEKAGDAVEEEQAENNEEVNEVASEPVEGEKKQETPPTPSKEPENSTPSTPVAPEPPVISKTPNQTPQQNQSTPNQNNTPNTNQTTPSQNSNQNTPNHSPMHTPGKTPRGRGFRGGPRGGQRARRSRR